MECTSCGYDTLILSPSNIRLCDFLFPPQVMVSGFLRFKTNNGASLQLTGGRFGVNIWNPNRSKQQIGEKLSHLESCQHNLWAKTNWKPSLSEPSQHHRSWWTWGTLAVQQRCWEGTTSIYEHALWRQGRLGVGKQLVRASEVLMRKWFSWKIDENWHVQTKNLEECSVQFEQFSDMQRSWEPDMKKSRGTWRVSAITKQWLASWHIVSCRIWYPLESRVPRVPWFVRSPSRHHRCRSPLDQLPRNDHPCDAGNLWFVII